MSTSKPRFSITIDEQLLSRINEHQHTMMFSTQNKAILDLVKIGLSQCVEPSSTMSEDESEILFYYHSLNHQGREIALTTLQSLASNPVLIKDTASDQMA